MSVVVTRGYAAALDAIAGTARQAGVFGDVVVAGRRLIARAAAAPAEYRVEVENGVLVIGVFTADRWLSHSVEADLLNTGDDLEDLLYEELVEVGYDGPAMTVDHFRNDEKMFAFRSKTGIGAEGENAAERGSLVLLAYQACFRHLGDMHKEEGED